MKRTAFTGLLAAGLILLPVQPRAQTNDPGPQFTLGELICVVCICGVLISITSCINHWANVPATSSPPPPDWPYPPGPIQPPDQNTNDDGDIDYALHHRVFVSGPAVQSPIAGVLDTNVSPAVPVTNYATFSLLTGTNLASVTEAYHFGVWMSLAGNDITVWDANWRPVARQYQPWGQTNKIFLGALGQRSEPQRYFKLLSQP